MKGNISDPVSAMRHQAFSSRILEKTPYLRLSDQDKRIFNRSRAISILQLYGFKSLIKDDFSGCADLLITHHNGEEFRVRVRPRPGFWKEHEYDGVLICCRGNDDHIWYLYPHDQMLLKAQSHLPFKDKPDWKKRGCYHFSPPIPAWLESLLEPYKLVGDWK